MKNAPALVAACFASVLIACVTVRTEYALPPQSLQAPAGAGVSRVFFYNDAEAGLFPASSRIGIKVDGKGIAAPKATEFVRIDLPPGRHHLYLSHTETLEMSDEYSLMIAEGDLYVRLYRTPLSASFESSHEQPDDFAQRFRPMRAAR